MCYSIKTGTTNCDIKNFNIKLGFTNNSNSALKNINKYFDKNIGRMEIIENSWKCLKNNKTNRNIIYLYSFDLKIK